MWEFSIPISALQHYVFCPRQCAYIHTDCVWDSNYFTAKGDQLHERVHSEITNARGSIRFERGVQVCSDEMGISGKLDLLEIDLATGRYTPVEYKRGKPKISDCDRVQLCAQVLCLEEMCKVQITKAAIWYWQVRKRNWVEIDESLRSLTFEAIEDTRKLLNSRMLPKAEFKKTCKACSLVERCKPKVNDHSVSFLQKMFASYEEII